MSFSLFGGGKARSMASSLPSAGAGTCVSCCNPGTWISSPSEDRKQPPNLILAHHGTTPPPSSNPFCERFFSLRYPLRRQGVVLETFRSQSPESGCGAEKCPDAKGLACQGLPLVSIGTITSRTAEHHPVASSKGVRVRPCCPPSNRSPKMPCPPHGWQGEQFPSSLGGVQLGWKNNPLLHYHWADELKTSFSILFFASPSTPAVGGTGKPLWLHPASPFGQHPKFLSWGLTALPALHESLEHPHLFHPGMAGNNLSSNNGLAE